MSSFGKFSAKTLNVKDNKALFQGIEKSLKESHDCPEFWQLLVNKLHNLSANENLEKLVEYNDGGIIKLATEYLLEHAKEESSESIDDILEAFTIFIEDKKGKEKASFFLNDIIKLLSNIDLNFSIKLEIFKIVNILLEGLPLSRVSQLKENVEVKSFIENCGDHLRQAGDFDLQSTILEAIFRILDSQEKELHVEEWFKQDIVKGAFLTIRNEDFESGCRVFLNQMNNASEERTVYSLPCSSFFLGMYQLKSPDYKNMKAFWVDFNVGSKSISAFVNDDAEAEASNLPWEIVVIKKDIVRDLRVNDTGTDLMVILKLTIPASELVPFCPESSEHYAKIVFSKEIDISNAINAVFGKVKYLQLPSASPSVTSTPAKASTAQCPFKIGSFAAGNQEKESSQEQLKPANEKTQQHSMKNLKSLEKDSRMDNKSNVELEDIIPETQDDCMDECSNKITFALPEKNITDLHNASYITEDEPAEQGKFKKSKIEPRKSLPRKSKAIGFSPFSFHERATPAKELQNLARKRKDTPDQENRVYVESSSSTTSNHSRVKFYGSYIKTSDEEFNPEQEEHNETTLDVDTSEIEKTKHELRALTDSSFTDPRKPKKKKLGKTFEKPKKSKSKKSSRVETTGRKRGRPRGTTKGYRDKKEQKNISILMDTGSSEEVTGAQKKKSRMKTQEKRKTKENSKKKSSGQIGTKKNYVPVNNEEKEVDQFIKRNKRQKPDNQLSDMEIGFEVVYSRQDQVSRSKQAKIEDIDILSEPREKDIHMEEFTPETSKKTSKQRFKYKPDTFQKQKKIRSMKTKNAKKSLLKLVGEEDEAPSTQSQVKTPNKEAREFVASKPCDLGSSVALYNEKEKKLHPIESFARICQRIVNGTDEDIIAEAQIDENNDLDISNKSDKEDDANKVKEGSSLAPLFYKRSKLLCDSGVASDLSLIESHKKDAGSNVNCSINTPYQTPAATDIDIQDKTKDQSNCAEVADSREDGFNFCEEDDLDIHDHVPHLKTPEVVKHFRKNSLGDATCEANMKRKLTWRRKQRTDIAVHEDDESSTNSTPLTPVIPKRKRKRKIQAEEIDSSESSDDENTRNLSSIDLTGNSTQKNDLTSLFTSFKDQMETIVEKKQFMLRSFTDAAAEFLNRKCTSTWKHHKEERVDLMSKMNAEIHLEMETLRKQTEDYQRLVLQQQKDFTKFATTQKQRMDRIEKINLLFHNAMKKLEEEQCTAKMHIDSQLKKEISRMQSSLLRESRKQEVSNFQRGLREILSSL